VPNNERGNDTMGLLSKIFKKKAKKVEVAPAAPVKTGPSPVVAPIKK